MKTFFQHPAQFGYFFAETMHIFVPVMAKNYFKSYIWLLETLQSRGRLTLRELQSLWLRSSINDEGKDLAPRTFSNHIAAILDVFGIEIACDRSDNTYYIKNEETVGSGEVREWMLEALSLNSLLNESAGMRDSIIFENVPSSHKYLTLVIQAIRDRRILHVVYKSYQKTAEEDLALEPLCLRQYKKRWYLFACKSANTEPHMYALDRFLSAEITGDGYKVPKSFNAQELFSGVYGARIYPDMKRETVKLKVSAFQANYFRSLPLHDSQEEIERGDEWSIFQYYLTPDYDFKQDVLSFGSSVEILEPKSLRAEFKKIVNEIKDKYD